MFKISRKLLVRPLLLALLALCLTVLAGTSVSAGRSIQTVIPTDPSINRYTEEADAILVVRVQDVASRYEPNEWVEDYIVSRVSFSPREIIKGDLDPQSPITLDRLPGGQVDNYVMATSDGPLFQPGQRYVLFLQDGRSGLWPIDSQAIMEVDSEDQVPAAGLSLAELRGVIFSILYEHRIYLPVIGADAGSSFMEGVPLATGSPPGGQQPAGGNRVQFNLNDRKWRGDSPIIEYLINNAGFNDANVGTVDDQNLAIINGAETWRVHGRSSFRLQFAGETTIRSNWDSYNVVVVANTFNPDHHSSLATTYTRWVSGSAYNHDCDIVFWDGHTFTVGGATNAHDIQAVATHEFGHVVGLDHTDPVRGTTLYSTHITGELHQRTLHLDDMNGIKAIYGQSLIMDDQAGPGINEANDKFATSLVLADFVPDDFDLDDLAVGAPGEDPAGPGPNTGVVFLFPSAGSYFGRPSVLTQAGADRPEGGDLFGEALAAGDFNGDSHTDLIVAAPGENLDGSGANTGAIFLFPGSISGLESPVLYDQEPAGRNEAGDRFGKALAVGDFDRDGYDDLAVGAPGEDIDGTGSATGVVFIFSGWVAGPGDPYFIRQYPAGRDEQGDQFGKALAVGDFNDDGFDDLAVGAPGEDIFGTGRGTGIVYIFSGSLSGLGEPYHIRQYPAGRDEAGDHFGSVLAAGNFDGDRYDDLAVGVPDEGLTGSGDNTGVVYIFSGSAGELGDAYHIRQYPYARDEEGDEFGSALASGDFNDDGIDELAIGATSEDIPGSSPNSGIVFIHQFGEDSGRREHWMLSLEQAPADDNEIGDKFGAALAVGKTDSGPQAHLVIGAPGESIDGSGAGTGAFFYWH